MKPTLVSRDVTRRLKEKEELKQIQKYEMGLNQVNQPDDLFGKSTSATNDKYIQQAMKEVRRSNETIDENLSRMHGTFFFNRNDSSKKNIKRSLTLENTIKELTTKQEINDENDYKNTLDAEKLIIRHGSPRDTKVMTNIKNKHDELGQLGVRDKKIRDGLYKSYINKLKVGDVTDIKQKTYESKVNEELSWRKICEQVDKPSLSESRVPNFFGQLREALTTSNKTRIHSLQRSSQYD